MIWSLIKVAIFIALAAALARGAAYLQDTPGEVRIAFGGQEISLTPLIFVLGSLVAFAAFWLLLKLAGFVVAILRFIKGDKTAFSRFWDKRREARGYRALADGMVALASGEGKLAAAKAAKAEKLLAKPELTRLISAQAAEMAGDRAQAIEIYKGLLENDRTRFVGVRGLMKAKLDEGDEKTALKLAEKAFALKPRHKETLDTLFGLQTRAADWGGARKTLLANSRAKLLPKDIVARRDAVLSVAEAMVAHETGDMEKTRDAALFASRNAPALVPAAILAAQVYISGNTPKHGVKVLKKAWETNPHPDLGAAFAAIRPDETPEKRIIRFQPLLKLRPDHPETAILATGLHLAAEDFPAARRALGDLPELAPTGQTLGMMAAIAKGEGAPEEVVRGWLARAVSAPRGEAWVCSACHSVQAKWAPLCSNCEGFDTLGWTLPAESENPVLSDAMLPLIERPAPEEIEQADPPEDVSEEPLEEVDTIATEIPENKS